MLLQKCVYCENHTKSWYISLVLVLYVWSYTYVIRTDVDHTTLQKYANIYNMGRSLMDLFRKYLYVLVELQLDWKDILTLKRRFFFFL
jgi:hypothetical protein